MNNKIILTEFDSRQAQQSTFIKNQTSPSMMKKIMYFVLLIASATLFGQKNSNMKFAIYNDVVGNVKMFDHYKNQIESVHVFKTKANLPKNLKKFDFLADKGLIEIKLKKNAGTPDLVSLEVLNEQYQIPKDTSVFIEGYEFSDTSTKVFNEMITKIDVKDENGKKALYISTTSL
ncbi:hypothetical protein [Chryseobacterium polytrichastri]|uniref:Uncharacterized protein n=1 Tax=Chryseobacterium polytrichastri TaxID=1302687 RepID=A0A1M6XMR7_9FLAO|nr:hypothetical protein [Chryseobacterium polytrichastri]SHL07267.1 hypothetical protein SAMN05444267_101161 [Chryseobacterium polytrichastri]